MKFNAVANLKERKYYRDSNHPNVRNGSSHVIASAPAGISTGPILTPYDQTNLERFVKSRNGPADVIIILDEYYATLKNTQDFFAVFTNILVLLTDGTPLGDQGLAVGLIVNSEKPQIGWPLKQGNSKANILKIPAPPLKVGVARVDMSRAYELAYKEFCKSGRAGSQKAVFLLTASASVSDPTEAVAELKSIGAELFVAPVGDIVVADVIIKLVGGEMSNIFAFSSYAEGAASVQWELVVPLVEIDKKPLLKCEQCCGSHVTSYHHC